MEDNNSLDKETIKPADPKEKSQDLDGFCCNSKVSKSDGAKKRPRKRKTKNKVSNDKDADVTSDLCAAGAGNVPEESCTIAPHSSDIALNAASICDGPSSQNGKKKTANKRDKRPAVTDVKMSTKEESDKEHLNTHRKNNPKLPQLSGPENGPRREKNRTYSNSPDFFFPDQKEKDCNSFMRKNRKVYAAGSRSTSVVDEDSFEDYMAPNVVEGLLQLPNYLKGTIRINQKVYTEAYISEPSGKRDILIQGIQNRNRALEGDEVVVAILPESEWKEISPDEIQQTGKVIHLLEAVHLRQAIGFLKPMPQKGSLQALFSPRDSRIPRMRIPINECPPDFDKKPDHLYCARISKWDNVRFARGNLLGKSIGIQGDIDVETASILLENDIRSDPYPCELIPQFPDKLGKADWKNREDLRKKCIFSIDPITARDLDDALSCEDLGNGKYLIGVHISDVSHYLCEDTPLDELVSKTATTTYLVQSVYHMLPRELTMKCSLLPGEDKLSFSVFWEFQETDTDVIVLSHRFTRSVMNSCAQLAYEHAQIMVDEPDKKWDASELPRIYNGYTPEDLSAIVCDLNRLAIKLRGRRSEIGFLRIDQTKLVFKLDDQGLPSNVSAYENKESHRLIEEFMLLANMTVAKALHDAYPRLAFLRQHSPPKDIMIRKLRQQLEALGIAIDPKTAKSLNDSLAPYKEDHSVTGVARFTALNSLLSKPMAQARYFCLARAPLEKDRRHFALNVPLYTHFTSPIRRYADVMVHRLLAALLGYSPAPCWPENYVVGVAANCNKRKYCAKKAGEQSSELFLAVYLKDHGPLRGVAVVVDSKDRSFDAIMCSTGTNVRIFTDKVGASVEVARKGGVFRHTLTWFPSEENKPVKQEVTIFSVVNMELKCSTTNCLKLEGVLLPPWEETSLGNLPGSTRTQETEMKSPSPEPCTIDLSALKLPDILHDVQEAV